MKRSIIYPGTFDPITYGHIDLVKRALKVFDGVIFAIAESNRKATFFSIDERIDLAKEALKSYAEVSVEGFDGLLTEFIKKKNISVVLRGMRVVTDFDHEFQLTWSHRQLAFDLETVFLMPSAECAYISSTMSKEIAALKGDVTAFVPKNVETALIRKFNRASCTLDAGVSNK